MGGWKITQVICLTGSHCRTATGFFSPLLQGCLKVLAPLSYVFFFLTLSYHDFMRFFTNKSIAIREKNEWNPSLYCH